MTNLSAASGKPTIYVDADACPVKAEVVKVGERHDLRPSRDPLVRHVVVPGTPDAADDWIVDEAKTNDIAITADVPLAARLVEKGLWAPPAGRSRRRPSAWRLPCAI